MSPCGYNTGNLIEPFFAIGLVPFIDNYEQHWDKDLCGEIIAHAYDSLRKQPKIWNYNLKGPIIF